MNMAASPFVRVALGIAFLTAMDAVVKGMMLAHPFWQAVCLRFAGGTLVALIVAAIVRPSWPTPDSIRANLIRVPVTVLTSAGFFYSVSVLPLAEALALAFLAPVFVAALGIPLLKEPVDRKIVAALAFGFAGMLVIVYPRFSGQMPGAPLGVAAALFAAVAYALNLVMLRKLAMREHPVTIVVFQTLGAAVVFAVPAAFVWAPVSLEQAAVYIGAGVLGVMGHLLLTSGFAKAHAARLAPLEYTGLIWASLLGFIFFGEVPITTTYVGALLIVAGALAVSRR